MQKYSTALHHYPCCSRAATQTLGGIKRNRFLPGTQLLHLGEKVENKMPCLRAYALGGIRTHNPLIASREYKPLHHSAPRNHMKVKLK